MFDPDLKYCPECKDEYRAEIEKCASCGVALQTGGEMLAREEERRRRLAGRPGKLSPDDDLVTVHRGGLVEIKRIEDLLAEEGIPSLIVGEEGSCGKGCCPSTYDLQIRREEAGEALQVIEGEFRRTTGLDYHDTTNADAVFNPDAIIAVCPACGHNFPPEQAVCPECGLCIG